MKNFSDKSDSEHLRTLLYSMTEELSLNFLERRGKYKNHKATLLEELQDVITELSRRERDIQTSAGIALMILDRNERLQTKINKLKTKHMQALEKAHHQSIDIKSLQEALVSAETRNEQINKTLVETEELMLINSAELNRIVRERFKEADIIVSDEEIDLIKNDFRKQLDAVQKKRFELEKENKKLYELNKAFDKQVNELKDSNAILESKYNKLYENIRENERIKSKYVDEIDSLEIQLKMMNSSYQKLKIHCERLEEEISILEVRDKDPIKSDITHALSLQSELEGMDDDSFEYNPSVFTQGEESIEDRVLLKPAHHHSQTSQTRASSLISYFKMFSLCYTNTINISPIRAQRKTPPEEYFVLTVQSVKMNSPHMDNICSISTHDLYEKAIKEGIPFHKWHIWIESQLNAAYVQQLYKMNRRSIWKKYSQKLCL